MSMSHSKLADTMVIKTKRGQERFKGIVVNTRNINKIVTCDHKHVYEDLAMVCARRIQQKQRIWLS